MAKKVKYIFISIIVLASMILASCASSPDQSPTEAEQPSSGEDTAGSDSSDEVVTLEFWIGFGEGDAEHLTELFNEYWAPTHPNIKINITHTKHRQEMLTAMAGGDSPDLVLSEATESIALWATQGAILDLTPALEPYIEQLEAEEVATGLQWVKFDGKYYGLPFVNFNMGFYWNKDLFIEAGLDPEVPPTTVDELREYAEILTKFDDDGNITQLGWMPMVGDTYRSLAYVLNFGGQFYDPDTLAPTINNPNIVEAFQWDLDTANIFGLDKVIAFTTGLNTAGTNGFQMGKVAMAIEGCWNPQFYALYAPELNYGVSATPYSDEAYYMANALGTNPLAVPVASPHPDEATEFAIWLTLNKDIAREFSGMVWNFPQLTSELETFSTDPNAMFFAEMSNSPNAVAWAPVPYAEQYVDELLTALGDMYNRGLSAQEALDAAQKILEDIAAPYVK